MTETTPSIIERFGSVNNAIERAEAAAARLLAEYDDSDLEWAAGFIAKVRHEAHLGDCAKAHWWHHAPMTCAACVYDEFMTKAWAELGVRR